MVGTLNVGGSGDAAASVVGNVYINVNGGKIKQVVQNTAKSKIDGDVIFTVNDFTAADDALYMFQGATVSAGHKRVLLLNNGKKLAAENEGKDGIQNVDVIVRASQKIYSTAVLNSDGTFANKLDASWSDLEFDRVVLKDASGRIVASSTAADKKATFAVSADGAYTLVGEKTSSTYLRGWQFGTNGNSIRFVATLDDLTCSGAGMEITAVAGEVTKNFGLDESGVTTTVYSSFSGDGLSYEATELATSYIYVAAINGLPSGEIAFTVKPFKVVNGERVYGETATVTCTVGE